MLSNRHVKALVATTLRCRNRCFRNTSYAVTTRTHWARFRRDYPPGHPSHQCRLLNFQRSPPSFRIWSVASIISGPMPSPMPLSQERLSHFVTRLSQGNIIGQCLRTIRQRNVTGQIPQTAKPRLCLCSHAYELRCVTYLVMTSQIASAPGQKTKTKLTL